MAAYGFVLLLSALAYWILEKTSIAAQGAHSVLRIAVGRKRKETISLVLYLAAMSAAFVSPAIAGAIYVAVALMWLIPDRRIERALGSDEA
jgi:uncharacterized membrane protein